jgi:hypothetical protein
MRGKTPRTPRASRPDRCIRCLAPIPAAAATCLRCQARAVSQTTIGRILVGEGCLSPAQLDEALELQRRTGRRLGNILAEKGFVPEDSFARTLARQLDIPYFDLEETVIDPAVVALVPEHLCERYRLIPVLKAGDKLVVAFSDPLDTDALADVRDLTGLTVRVVAAAPGAVRSALSHAFDAVAASLVRRTAAVRPAARPRALRSPTGGRDPRAAASKPDPGADPTP